MADVHCRLCKKSINRDKQTDWMTPSRNYFYHIKCYEDWLGRKSDRIIKYDLEADEWYDLLKEYLWRDIKLPDIDFVKISSQWKTFLGTTKYTAKGIYFAVIYSYEVLHSDKNKAQGGIGLVPNIYFESAQYWADLEQKRAGTLEAIVKQMAARANRQTLTIVKGSANKVDRAKFKLDDIIGEENGR